MNQRGELHKKEKMLKKEMKKIKSLKDLANLMESLGATKDEEPGFTSWTLDCGPGRQAPSDKQQAASVKLRPQFNDIKKNES